MVRLSKADNHCYLYATKMADIEAAGGCLPVTLDKYTIAIFIHNSKIYAVDNRCPHMGFPLNQGSVKDGILTCHWHHARFDLLNGGTFDQWAGDVTSFPVQIRKKNEVWIDVSSAVLDTDSSHNQTLLSNGLKRNTPLMIAKAVLAMIGQRKKLDAKEKDAGLLNAFRVGLDFGSHCKQSGWGQGLSIHTCMMNIIPYLDIQDRPYAMCHGLSAVAQDCASTPSRIEISPLPKPWPNLSTLKQWFRKFVESHDAQAAERCIVTAVGLGATSSQISDILFAAATDHRYLDSGHLLDFTNKALEALDIVGWDNNKDLVESVLSSLVSGYANAERMEESSSWRNPIDLIDILEKAFKELPSVLKNGSGVRGNRSKKRRWNKRSQLVAVLLGDDPQMVVNELLEALNQGAREVELASSVAYAAALRIVQFHTRNEFSDWDAALHTFSHANAVHQGLRRIATRELLRGVFDGAMRVYLNRFLNVPLVPLPKPTMIERNNSIECQAMLLKDLPSVLDKQQQVNQAGQLVADYLYIGGNPDRLLAEIGKALLREDRNFHSIQMVEGIFRQYSLISNDEDNTMTTMHLLTAVARYLAAHSPTMRSQGRTYQIANQLYHGEHLFEE
ncbi:MAG: Rieske (2Fe-2S) protein [Nitrososphaeraceae archaeon]|nr:Rieske (2Fe-2S) protein [Nitrososphaeraceae archaeon]